MGTFLKICASEICVKRIRVNQGVGVVKTYVLFNMAYTVVSNLYHSDDLALELSHGEFPRSNPTNNNTCHKTQFAFTHFFSWTVEYQCLEKVGVCFDFLAETTIFKQMSMFVII